MSQRERGSTHPTCVANGFSHVTVEFLILSDSPAAGYFGIRHPVLHLPCLNYFMTLAVIPKTPLIWESRQPLASELWISHLLRWLLLLKNPAEP